MTQWVAQSLFRQGLSHNQKVVILYRRALKTALDWCDTRPIYYQWAANIKKEFRSYNHIRDPFILNKLITNGEKRVLDKAHPNPYIRSYFSFKKKLKKTKQNTKQTTQKK